MSKDIKILLIVLLVGLVVLIYLNNNSSVQHFTTDSLEDSKKRALTNKNNETENSIKENQLTSDKIMSDINKNQKINSDDDLDNLITSDDVKSAENINDKWMNPLSSGVNTEKALNSDDQQLDELMREVNMGSRNSSPSEQAQLFKDRVKSVNSSNGYRKVSYDSDFRVDFNGLAGKSAKDELDKLYEESNVFVSDSDNRNNSNFKGMTETFDNNYASPDTNAFKNNAQTQQDKVMQLFDNKNYLPNQNKTDQNLSKGFQILDNPTSVDNPNLIPVLRSIPVSSTLGSKRNSTYDIRAEPPNPKTVVAPFLNSSIMPDIYASQRGCLN
jgi:hypothetical protein